VSIKIKRKSAIGVGPPPSGTAVAGAKDASKAAQVREHGLKMWAAVRAARSKEYVKSPLCAVLSCCRWVQLAPRIFSM
jgi:hypothetical protein